MSAPTAKDLETLERYAQRGARMVGPHFEAVGAGFVLLGFTFGPGGWMTYTSNANRADIVKALRETADRLERNEDIPPAGPDAPQAA